MICILWTNHLGFTFSLSPLSSMEFLSMGAWNGTQGVIMVTRFLLANFKFVFLCHSFSLPQWHCITNKFQCWNELFNQTDPCLHPSNFNHSVYFSSPFFLMSVSNMLSTEPVALKLRSPMILYFNAHWQSL